ncbi:MAG: hypothetical protein ABIK09_02295 [Pseudomonadota bacterium]
MLLLLLFAAACGGGGPGTVEVPAEDAAADTGLDILWNWDTGPSDTGPQPDAGGDVAGEGLLTDGIVDTLDDGLPTDTWAPTPCSSHADCDDGLCIEHPPGSGSSICAPFCNDECPPGWECSAVLIDGPDPVSVCMPPVDMLCSTCSTHADCVFVGSLCISADGGEGFCGRACAEGAGDCPDGFDCQIMTDPDGEPIAWQCRPIPGACCAGGAWVDCDDDNPCTLDACEPGTGCVHVPQDVLCDGPAPCTDYQCIDGECVGWPITQDKTWDGVDDDCDGVTDEDVVKGLEVNAWTYGSGLGVSEGGGLRLVGRINTPGFHGVSAGGTLVLEPGVPW